MNTDELRKLLADGPDRPWYVATDGRIYDGRGRQVRPVLGAGAGLIVAAVNALPLLLDELDRWKEQADADRHLVDGWYERAVKAERELDELLSLIPVLLERVQRGGPSNLLDVAEKYMTDVQAARLRSLVGDTDTKDET